MTPDDPVVALLRRGLQARREGRLPAARADFEAALRLRPGQADALHLLGELAQAEGRLDDAAALLEQALRAQPNQPQAWSRLGAVQEDRGRLDAAAGAWEQAVALAPGFAEALYNLARCRRAQARPAESATLTERAIASATSPLLQAQAWQLRALLHEEAGDLDHALAAIDRAIAQAPTRAAAHHNRGVLLQRLGRHGEALPAFDRALMLGLDAADAHYNRGNALQSLHRQDEAAAAYRTALARDGQHALALYDLARLRWRRGDADFDAELVAAAAAAPSSPLAHGLRARLLLRAERASDALAAFDAALARAPDSAGYHDGRGQALLRLGRHGEAVTAHRRAVELAPEDAAAHVGLATALLQSGQADAASPVIAQALRLAPDDQTAWAVQGLVWRVLGDPRSAWLDDPQRLVQVFDLPPPAGFADGAAFNAALADVLMARHVDREAPVDQTLRHGSQTAGRLFDDGDALIGALRDAIGTAIDRYLQTLRAGAADPTHPLRRRLATGWRFTDSWSSMLRRGGFHTRHVHPQGWISSCYYVALPPSVQRPAADGSAGPGWIAFGEPDSVPPGLAPGPLRTVQPAVGRLVLFPSYLWHGTVPFDDDAVRLTVAFDVVPQG